MTQNGPIHTEFATLKNLVCSAAEAECGHLFINCQKAIEIKTNTLKELSGVIQVDSINTSHKKRDADLKSARLFDAIKYPEITVTLDKIDSNYAYGKLTMHGVTKDIKLNFENNGMVKDPWGDTRVGLELSGKLSRNDYGIIWNKVLEAGGVLIGDTIRFNIQIEGILVK